MTKEKSAQAAFDKKKAEEFCRKFFAPKSVETQFVERGLNYFKDNCYQAGYDPSNNWSPTINCKNIFISKLLPMELIGLDLSKHV